MTRILRRFSTPGRPCAAMLLLFSFALPAARAEGPAGAPGVEGEPAPAPNRGTSVGNDVICGPRCVGFVLEYYGRPEPLRQLVGEIQSRDFERGATLDRIERALRDRGISTAALRLRPGAVLASKYPVIVHLRPEGDGSHVGHYVVWLPGSTHYDCAVWSGLPGIQSGTWDQLRSRMSGVVLLTAPDRIGSTSGFIVRSNWLRRALDNPLVQLTLVLLPISALFVLARYSSAWWRHPLRRSLGH